MPPPAYPSGWLWACRRRRSTDSRATAPTPKGLVFRVPREGLEAKVHQRVNVRVLELIDTESGSRIELEGMRLPITHSKDVIQELT